MDAADINNRFAYHGQGDPDRASKHTVIRSNCRVLADFFNETLPEGREKSLAVTRVEEAMFWANAAVARPPLETAAP